MIRTSSCPSASAKIERAGQHVTIVAFSRMVGMALEAAEELARARASRPR